MDVTKIVGEYLDEVRERALEQLGAEPDRKWEILSCIRAEIFGVVMFAQRVGGNYGELKPIADAVDAAVFDAFTKC